MGNNKSKTVNGACDAWAPQDPASEHKRMAKKYKKWNDERPNTSYMHSETNTVD